MEISVSPNICLPRSQIDRTEQPPLAFVETFVNNRKVMVAWPAPVAFYRNGRVATAVNTVLVEELAVRQGASTYIAAAFPYVPSDNQVRSTNPKYALIRAV